MSTNNWKNPLFYGIFDDLFNCMYGTFCPICAIASAKSKFDGSSWCFNCCCFGCSPQITRNYIRVGYDIDGRVGTSDMTIPKYCCPCVAVQMLNEVEIRGPKIVSIASIEQSGYLAPHKDYSCLRDCTDCYYTMCNFNDEKYAVYSQLTGVPLWFGCYNRINSCQIHHIVRKSYGIGGDDCYDDCVRPTVCCIIPFWNCIYGYKLISMWRAEIYHRGRPKNFVVSEPHDTAEIVMIENKIHA